MNKVICILFLSMLLLLALPTTAFAQPDLQTGCPVGFHLHNDMDQDDHTSDMHRHVGTAADQNGDGFICGKYTSTSIHLHIDNLFPVKQLKPTTQ